MYGHSIPLPFAIPVPLIPFHSDYYSQCHPYICVCVCGVPINRQYANDWCHLLECIRVCYSPLSLIVSLLHLSSHYQIRLPLFPSVGVFGVCCGIMNIRKDTSGYWHSVPVLLFIWFYLVFLCLLLLTQLYFVVAIIHMHMPNPIHMIDSFPFIVWLCDWPFHALCTLFLLSHTLLSMGEIDFSITHIIIGIISYE